MVGNTLGPAEAYRFARGEEVIASHGMRVRLIRPLDFLVVADHAENLGLAPFIAELSAGGVSDDSRAPPSCRLTMTTGMMTGVRVVEMASVLEAGRRAG